MDPGWVEYPALLIFLSHAQVVLMSQGFAVEARLTGPYASSLLESSKNFLRRLFPNGQSLLIRSLLGICQSDLKVERMVEGWSVSFCLKSEIKEVENYARLLCSCCQCGKATWNEVTLHQVIKFGQNTDSKMKVNVCCSVFMKKPVFHRCYDWVAAKVTSWRRLFVCCCASVLTCLHSW